MTLVKFANGHKNGFNPLFTDVFDSILNDTFLSDKLVAKTPAVNIAENENGYGIELAAPGLKKEDFKISVEKNVLSIAVEKKSENAEETKKYSKREYSYSSFVRNFTLPQSADQANISAEYADGILTVNVAKKEEAKIQTREIEVK
ncbi:heat-shock protein [Mucilaginibacter sp. PPCGB 2223]|uniref:Hsp20/alpha crystallin family protein n=1 Tax=Mucilaginibacter sp. PPCGB 2223 TaxID=1886027 RepID=UPI000826EAD3|nr:Hsp20/alpha crystallin family protein [Mucilaginibacter sp. PPCGB 2223]OCX51641.1 heat-shock protein [Mucilaginibacter sp. PPCGB 2223]